ncbi:MAG TPA: AAA family ATPase [Acidimicrobiales bacterium]|nr:AAA family ATPase [Acidimicrobiales bacterium]
MGETGDALVGREAQLATLAAMVADARAGRGRAVLILGEAGIGKTRLADAAAELAADAGMDVSWGRNPDSEAPAYWPWTQALGAEFPGEGGGGRHELFAATVEALQRAGAARPLALIFDDVHWADAASVALLQFVVSAVPGLRVLLVMTARDDPSEGEAVVSAGLTALPPTVVRLQVPGLDAASTAEVVRGLVGDGVPDDLTAEVFARTGGNPFFVTEVARLHAARGERAGIEVPRGVQQVLSRRIARLSQPASELLGVAALLGEPRVAVLAAVTGQSDDKVLTLLDEAVQARLVTKVDAGFVFAHALVRDTLAGDLSPAITARVHRELAEALPTEQAADIAMHWIRAGDPARAARPALEAARQAAAAMGYEQAVRYFRIALDGGVADRTAVLVELGEAQVLAGELGAGRAALRQAAADARTEGRGELLARAVLAMGTGVGGFEVDVFDPQQPPLLEDAVAALPGHDGALRAAVLARLSMALASEYSDDARRVTLAHEAVEMARRVGDVETEVSALAAASDALAGPDHVAQRLEMADRMVQLAEVAGNDVLSLLGRRLRLVAMLESGDLAGVDTEIRSYERITDRLRLPLFSWPVPLWKGMRALMQGDVDTAFARADEVAALGEQADSANANVMAFTLRMAAHRTSGTVAEFIDEALALSAEWSDYPPFECMTAAAYAEAGQLETARAYARRAVEQRLPTMPKDSEWLEAMWLLGDAAIPIDDREAAQVAFDALSPYAHLWAVDGIGGACYGCVADQLARLREYLDGAASRPSGDKGAVSAPLSPLGQVFRREGRVWHVEFRGRAATVPDSKGMADLATLLARPGTEVHVLDLVEAAGGPSAKAAAREAGTGPALDAAARRAYKARLEELQAGIDDAPPGSAGVEQLVAERDFIAAELGAALGLGGKARTTGDRVERARKAVTMRVGTALKAIEGVHPDLARHLRLAVSTGRFCTYRPENEISWDT